MTRLTLLIRRILTTQWDRSRGRRRKLGFVAPWHYAASWLAHAATFLQKQISQAAIFRSLRFGSSGVRQDATLAGLGAAASLTTGAEPRRGICVMLGRWSELDDSATEAIAIVITAATIR
jgi:hypothetical protein